MFKKSFLTGFVLAVSSLCANAAEVEQGVLFARDGGMSTSRFEVNDLASFKKAPLKLFFEVPSIKIGNMNGTERVSRTGHACETHQLGAALEGKVTKDLRIDLLRANEQRPGPDSIVIVCQMAEPNPLWVQAQAGGVRVPFIAKTSLTQDQDMEGKIVAQYKTMSFHHRDAVVMVVYQ